MVFTGISRFVLEGDLIANYTEIFDPGVSMTQLGFSAERIAKRARRSVQALRGEPEMEKFLAGADVTLSN